MKYNMNMRARGILLLILGLGIILGTGLYAASFNFVTQQPAPISPGAPPPSPVPVGDSNIQITAPLPGVVISSPVAVSGKALGSYYFEATFPVKVLDGDGTVLGQGQAWAQSEWTVPGSVPFAGSIMFTKPKFAIGTIVFQNDNPSGDPARSKQFELQVRFKENTTAVDNVTGIVLLGPTCPVERIPPDPQCAPKPYTGAIVEVWTDVQRKHLLIPDTEIAKSTADNNGAFSFTLYPDYYRLIVYQEGKPYPRCEEKQITVASGVPQNVTMNCDTGIR